MATPDPYRDNIIKFEERLGNKAIPEALKSGGGDGTFDGMEARVARLEEDMKEVRADLKAIRGDLTGLKTDIAELKGYVRALPTTLQLIGFIVAIFVAAGLTRYFGH